jgi:hypothetical protein
MKKKISLFILINFLGFQLVHSQNTMTNTTKDALNNLSGSQKINANSVLYGIPTPPSEIVGDFFYDSTFVPAKVVLVGDKTVYETFARLDLKNKILEIIKLVFLPSILKIRLNQLYFLMLKIF